MSRTFSRFDEPFRVDVPGTTADIRAHTLACHLDSAAFATRRGCEWSSVCDSARFHGG